MNWTKRQVRIDISGTEFPRFEDNSGNSTERFWYVREEFLKHSKKLLKVGGRFSHISGHLVDSKWICENDSVSEASISSFLREMRLFYMKTESMSIYSFCRYMGKNIFNTKVRMFFSHMRENWTECLSRDASLYNGYEGAIKTNKQLIDTVLYSGHFHSQEKYKKRYDDLLKYVDESLVLMNTYNAMHSGYQMNQISRAICELREDNLVILLPAHLQHEWDENCPYKIIR